MDRDQKRQAYEAFFVKSEAGKEFINSLSQLKARNYVAAEENPDSARDLLQRNRGITEVINVIQTVITKPKKEGDGKKR